MTIYHYKGESPITQITWRKTANGALRAYLHARPGLDEDTTHAIMQRLNKAEYECVPFSLDGNPTLEVRGFKKPAELTKALSPWVGSKPKIIREKTDKITWKDWFAKRTLQFTGAAYLVGDYGFWNYGRKEADKLVMAGAFSYFLGTLALLFYGRNDQSTIQIEEFATQMKQHLAEENITLQHDTPLEQISRDHHKGPLQKFHDFMQHYPSEVFNSVTALAGVFIAISAVKNKIMFKRAGMDSKAIREALHEGWLDFGLGSLTMTSGILATVVKEKKPDPDAPRPKGLLNRAWEKIQEHPLAIASAGYTVSTMCHAFSTFKAYREAKRLNDHERLASVPHRALFVGMAFLSEMLLAISSKGHGQGVKSDSSVDNTVISLAADMIARQPEHMQAKAIECTAAFLGRPDVLAIKNDKAKAMLSEAVQRMHQNPWIQPSQAKAPAVEKQVEQHKWRETVMQPSATMQSEHRL